MTTCNTCGAELIANKRGVLYCAACASKLHYIIPLRPHVKPRPRITRNGTHMPDDYTAWRARVRMYLCCDTMPAFAGLLGMSLVFRFKKKGRGDADNLAGGIMDACQGSLYDDDANIIELDVKIERHTGRDEIEVSIWEL